MWTGRSCAVFLRGVDGGDEHSPDRAAGTSERVDTVEVGNACTLEQLQPVFRLITFLERDLELGDEVCLSVRITRLTNVGPDGGGRAFELIHEGAVAVYGFAELQRLYGKIHGQVGELVFSHGVNSFDEIVHAHGEISGCRRQMKSLLRSGERKSVHPSPQRFHTRRVLHPARQDFTRPQDGFH